MAKRVVETFVDDLDHSLEADETVRFALDGVEREIDLSAENAEKLRGAFEPWVAASRRIGGRQTRATAKPSSGVDPRAVRRWARSQGIEVSSMGRVPQSVVEQYEAAQR